MGKTKSEKLRKAFVVFDGTPENLEWIRQFHPAATIARMVIGDGPIRLDESGSLTLRIMEGESSYLNLFSVGAKVPLKKLG